MSRTFYAFVPLLLTSGVLLLAAGLPTPVIHGGLEQGSTVVRGSLSLPPAGAVTTLKIFVNGQETAAAKVLLELARGEFEIHIGEPLRGGDHVQVQHFATPNLASEFSPIRRVPGTPRVMGKLEDGGTEVSVKAVSGASAVVAVVTDSADKIRVQTGQASVPADCSKEPAKCEVAIKLSVALSEGERVRVQEEGGPLSDPSKVRAKSTDPFKASLSSVEAYYGGQLVKVFFEKLPEKVEKATVKVETCLETKERPFTDEERKANSLEVALDRGLFCKSDVKVHVTVTTQTKGDTEGRASNCKDQDCKVELLIPRITLDPPLNEGDGAVTGKANGGVPKVRIQVYSGWQLEPLSDSAKVNALIKKRKEQARIAEKNALEAIAKKKEQYNVLLATLTRQIKALETEPFEMAEPLVASSPAEREAVRQCRSGELVQESEDQAITDGKFSVTLESRLNAGECVIAVAAFAKQAPVTVNSPLDYVVTSRAETVRSVILDWGRLRGYFTLGGAVSNYRDQFSQVDTFIGFTSDSRVAGELIDKPNSTGPLQLRRFRWQVNIFTDARVSFRLANSTGTPAANGTSATVQTPTAVITDPRLNYSADQPGYLLGAIHIPMSFKGMDWRHLGEQYSFFFAPIFRFGGQTQSTPTVVYRHLKVKDGSSPTTFDVYREETRGGVLPMWGYGARFGIYKYDLLAGAKRQQAEARQRQVANDPIGYADITWGKSYAYRSYGYAYTVNGQKSTAGNYQFLTDKKLTDVEISSSVRNRLNIETRLKIPKLPALIGADMNVRTNSADFEPNQLRFVLAFRIDAQKALGRIFGDNLTVKK